MNGLDVDSFVAAVLAGGTQPVSEPSTFYSASLHWAWSADGGRGRVMAERWDGPSERVRSMNQLRASSVGTMWQGLSCCDLGALELATRMNG